MPEYLIKITEEGDETLEKLRLATGARCKTDTLLDAICLYEVLVEHVSKGERVMLMGPHGGLFDVTMDSLTNALTYSKRNVQ